MKNIVASGVIFVVLVLFMSSCFASPADDFRDFKTGIEAIVVGEQYSSPDYLIYDGISKQFPGLERYIGKVGRVSILVFVSRESKRVVAAGFEIKNDRGEGFYSLYEPLSQYFTEKYNRDFYREKPNPSNSCRFWKTENGMRAVVRKNNYTLANPPYMQTMVVIESNESDIDWIGNYNK